MRSVVQGIQDGTVHADAAVVISNKETAPALEFAKDAGIPTVVVDHRPFAKDRKSFEEVIDRALRDHGVDLVGSKDVFAASGSYVYPMHLYVFGRLGKRTAINPNNAIIPMQLTRQHPPQPA